MPVLRQLAHPVFDLALFEFLATPVNPSVSRSSPYVRAIDLLHDAGEAANKHGEPVVTEEHVHAANDSVVKNRVLEIVEGMSLHKRLSLYAAAVVASMNNGAAPSPVVYTLYRKICRRTDRDVYTQETVNSHINKAGTYGVLESDRTSGGFKTGVYLMFIFTEPVEAVIETLEQAAVFDEIDPSVTHSTARQALRE